MSKEDYKTMIGSPAFQIAFALLMTHEGGFVNNPVDSGGPTKYGITMSSYDSYFHAAPTIEDIKAITIDEAAQFYYEIYWQSMQLDDFSTNIATILFDQAVLNGTPTIIKRLQHVLEIPVDGRLGPGTIAALKESDSKRLSFNFIEHSAKTYIDIVKSRPEKIIFLNGWIERLLNLLNFVFLNEQQNVA